MSGLREVLAGATGFLIFVVASVLLFQLTGYDPHRAVTTSFRIISVVCGIAFAFAAGYIVALISPRSPMRPALIVALLIAISAILSILVSGSAEAWSQLAALFLMAPAVVVGAHMRRRSTAANGVDANGE